MIETAVYTYRYNRIWTRAEAMLGYWSVLWAMRYFKNVVLATDDYGASLLINSLQLPFHEVIPIPSRAESHVNSHVYAVPKLQTAVAMGLRGSPYLHMDFDTIFRKQLPARILQAGVVGEYLYQTIKWANDINRRYPRHPVMPKSSLACGFFGGNDIAAISRVAELSLEFEKQHDLGHYNGYQSSVLIEEVALGAITTDELLVRGRESTYGEYHQLGYMHVAGQKTDRGAMAQAEMAFSCDFPDEHREMHSLHSCITDR